MAVGMGEGVSVGTGVFVGLGVGEGAGVLVAGMSVEVSRFVVGWGPSVVGFQRSILYIVINTSYQYRIFRFE